MDIKQQAAQILTFWFGDLDDSGFSHPSKQALWFGSRPEDDAALASRFGDLIAAAADGALMEWEYVSDAANMALILLADQMTRAVYRGSARAFSGDAIARAVCKNGITDGRHARLPPGWRLFYYLPLEHSEALDDQELCVQHYTQLQQAYPGSGDKLEQAIHYAQLHHDIIKRFGRFPHRNAILGRTSTAEEAHYLADSGQHFGQKSAK